MLERIRKVGRVVVDEISGRADERRWEEAIKRDTLKQEKKERRELKQLVKSTRDR